MNTLAMVGRLTVDPAEPTTTTNGHRVLEIRVAINTHNRSTVFVTVQCWDSTADNVARFLTRGSQVGIEGELAQDEWNDAGLGQRRSRPYVRAQRIGFLDRSSSDRGNGLAADV